MSGTRPVIVAFSAVLTALAGQAGAQTAELPMPCVAGVCGASIPGFVSAGRATATATGNTLRVQQQSDRAVMNWASFNVGPDGRVVFEQPGASSIALNRIFQGSPSRILGAIEANGQVFLVNQNGFLFGPTARVRTAGLLVSSLNMADSVFENGLLSPDLLRDKRPALESDGRVSVLDNQGKPVLGDDGKPLEVKITIAAGAKIETIGSGGRVLLASRTVDNAGEIATPDGQTVIAAGEKVYLEASTDPELRGLLVEVDAGGAAWNRVTGNVSAARGNVTMVGLAVNQEGRVSATSTVTAGGSIRLLARDTVTQVFDSANNPHLASTHGGTLTLAGSSVTAVSPELADRTTAIDEQKQTPSRIEMQGREVYLRSGASVVAHGGDIRLSAVGNPNLPQQTDPQARVRIENGAVVDASGSNATASVSRNVVRVELRGNELRDSPLQRDGLLRGKEVFVDARVGTPLADVSGAVAGIGRTIDERTSVGGSISVSSAGDIVVAPGARFDVSGGRVDYTAGSVQTTQLLTADGRAVDIGQASRDQTYIGLINPSSQRRFDRWGVVEQVQGPLIGRYEPGYVEGKSAGTLSFLGSSLSLNGNFQANTIVGPYQRDAARAPAGGRFIVGAADGGETLIDYRTPSINLVSTRVPVAIADDAMLPPRPLDLPVDFMTLGGFTRTELYSNGVVHIPESMMLALAPGSSLRITAHRVEANGDIVAPGGSVRLTSVFTSGLDGAVLPRAGVSVAADSSIDVRGTWNNELSLLTPVYRDGGEIDLAVRALGGELVLGDRAQLLASGGASLSTAGAVTGGRGGRIAIRAGAGGGALDIGEDVAVSAFGVAGARGGSFALEAPRVEIIAGDSWAGAQRLDLLEGDAGFLQIGTDLFSQHGFAAFDILASGPKPRGSDDEDAAPETLAVREGATLDVFARTLELFGNISSQTSGGAVDAFARSTLLPDFKRGATSIALRAEPRDFVGADSVGALITEAGSTIRVDARGTVSFNAPGGMTLGGAIHAPGGVINASLPVPSAEAFDGGYRPDLGIIIGPDAILDVAGISLLRPSDAGLLAGEVLAGGAVNLLADRGFIDVQAGSRIDISGTSAALDLPAGGGYQRHRIASAGGSLTLRAPESLAFAADFAAHAGTGDMAVAGGSARFQLTRQRGFTPGPLPESYPTDPRTLLVVPDASAVSPGRNGLGVIDASRLRTAGVDSLSLEAGSRIELYSGADLNMARSLQLAAPLIGVSGDSVQLSAPFVSLGSFFPVTPAAPVSGIGRLRVNADLLELFGPMTLTGIADARFEASSEIRLRGVETTAGSAGSLNIAGDLTLRAPLIAPSTLTRYSIVAEGGARDAVRFETPGAISDRTPLSVGGELDVRARTISQGTRLHAPFGAIRLTASEQLTLEDGSVTSVSAVGSLLPFGRVQLGSDWFYLLGGVQVRPDLDAHRVDLSGSEVSIAANATVDLRGGGDLLTYEWLPGTGGSRDALAAGQTPGLYAILPQLREGFAPFDPQEFIGSDLKPGDSIYLSASSGLPAGIYPLLPARYALLPGAMLVSAVAGTTDAVPGENTQFADGTQIVAGYRTFASSGLGDARYSGFAVRPGSYASRLASYEIFQASTFDADTRPVAPANAGSLGLSATRAFALNGRVQSAAAAGGRGASVDISAQNLLLTAGAATDANAVTVNLGQTRDWNAASVLLGGRRLADGSIDVEADQVTFAEDARYQGNELIAVAREELRLAAGSDLATPGSSTPQVSEDDVPLRLAGDNAGAAVLAISDSRVIAVERVDATSPVTAGLRVDAGARVTTRGSLLFDAPRSMAIDGTIDGRGASWTLGSSSIAFGDTPRETGLAIGTALQSSMRLASRLRLDARDEFDLDGAVDIGTVVNGQYSLDSLILHAPLMRAANAATTARFTARELTLLGAGEAGALPVDAGGTLSLSARELTLGPGSISLGFVDVALSADREIVGSGISRVNAAGDVHMTATNIGTRSDADLGITAGGTLRTARSGAFTDQARAGRELGGRLSLAGQAVQHDGTIRIGSGLVNLTAETSIALGAGSILDVSGALVSAGGRSMGSAGGSLELDSRGLLAVASGAQLRVAGAGLADAGSIVVRAANDATIAGSFDAHSASGARGGIFDLRAGTLSDFGALNAALESGGFTQRRAVHVGSGDLDLAAGGRLTAHDVELISDSGRVRIAGTVDASSSAQRGTVWLAGESGLELSATGRILASGTGELGRGGHATLESRAGVVSLAAGSQIALDGVNEPGQLVIRAPATSDGMQLGSLGASVSGVDAIILQPLLQFALVNDPFASDFTTIRNSLTAFANIATPALQTRFASSAKPVVVRLGAELNTDGDLTLGSLDLAAWRFAGKPADLSFNATGSITINGTVSDGFQTVVGRDLVRRLDLLPGPSSGLSFVAGTDISLGFGARVRTGTGDLSLIAGQDLLFGENSSVYTGGTPGEATHEFTRGASLALPTQGGQLSLVAARDIFGAPVTQSVGEWQVRQGRPSFNPDSEPGWGTDLQRFGWNVGTLGGGDLRVRAGRNIDNLSAAVADSASLAGGVLRNFAGGTLDMWAGGDIDSAFLHLTAGENHLRAGGEFGRSRLSDNGVLLGSVFSLQDASLDVTARRGVAVQAVFNPTVLSQALTANAFRSYFFTYGEDSALRATTATGDVSYAFTADSLVPFLGADDAVGGNDERLLSLAPPSVSFAALDGDVRIDGAMTLFPADRSQLDLFASRDVVSGAGSLLTMSDAAATALPTATRQSASVDFAVEVVRRAASGRHIDDDAPVLITAGRDVANLYIELPKFARMTAGRDLSSASLFGQNLRATDATILTAGRDIVFEPSNSQIEIGGPGRLDIVAARHVDLGFSAGITTIGRNLNAALTTEEGADINLIAGLGRALGIDEFLEKIVADSADHRGELVRFVGEQLGLIGGTFETALTAFRDLSQDLQRDFAIDVFFKELVASGREANNVPGAGFERGYAAIDALLPGSRVGEGLPASPYEGDLRLAFSRIYTLADADISLLVPGGLVNVGLAVPPVGISAREPSQLGIVAQRAGSVRIFANDDVIVNSSRVFTLRGGDIAIWSTIGDIDAGRGAKSAISAPPPTILVDASGRVTLDFAGAVAGSGIRAIVTDENVDPGDVDLIAPSGIVDAGDAGIGSAGNLNVAAQQVVGLDNIQVGGTSTGVPAETSSLGAALSGASAVGNSATSAANDASVGAAAQTTAPLADSAFGFLDVFLEGFGSDVCKPDDTECLKRNHK